MKILARVWQLLDAAERRQLIGLHLLSVLMACSTVGGIAAIVPFFTVLEDPAAVHRSVALQFLRLRFSSDSEFTAALGVGFVACVLLANTINLFGTLAINRFALRVGTSFHLRLFAGYLDRDYGFHARTHSSALATKVLHETGRVTTGILQQGLILIANLCTIVIVVGSILWLNPLVAAGAILVLGCGYTLTYTNMRARLARNGRVESHRYAERNQLVHESFGAIREISLLRAQPLFLRRLADQCRAIARGELSTLAISLAPRSVLECLTVTCLIAVALYFRGSHEAGTAPWIAQLSFIGFAAYRVLPALQQSFTALVRIRANRAALESIAGDLGDTRGEDLVQRFIAEPPRVTMQSGIQLRGVSFRYSAGGPDVLSEVSLSVEAGAYIGFMGANGSGKTTLADVLAGLLAVSSGQMEVDGQALDESLRRAWRTNVAYVPQHVFLLDTTVAENVALGVAPERIDRERLEMAVRLASLEECVAALPNGYGERLGERGCRLSGGQRQRLGIARALYRDASVLILDEATSALDATAEEEIIGMLQRLRAGRTIVQIAHRLSSLRYCDRIYELQHGRIAHMVTQASPRSGAADRRGSPVESVIGRSSAL